MTNWSFRVSSDQAGTPPRFEVNGRVLHGRLEDPMLPYPVTDLQADVHADNSGILVGNLKASHGPTTWEISEFRQTGFEPRSPFVLRAAAGRYAWIGAGHRPCPSRGASIGLNTIRTAK